MILFSRILQFIADQHSKKTFLFSSQVHPAFMEAPKKPCEEPCGCEAEKPGVNPSAERRPVLQSVKGCYCQRALYQVVEF